MTLDDKVIQVLMKKGVPFTRHNHEINCRCLTGKHPDKRPSMWINCDKNVYYCFSCQSSGHATDLLDIKLDPDDERFYKYKQYLEEIEKAQTPISQAVGFPSQLLPPQSGIPLPSEWRGIDGKLLEELGCYYCIKGRYAGRLIMPSFDPATQEPNGFDARIFPEYNKLYNVTPKAETAKYLRPSVLKTADAYWIPKQLPETWDGHAYYVVLTEGVVDAISLLSLGYNAVANYGLGPMTSNRAGLLYTLGVQSIIMGLDLDKAGFAALPTIVKSIKRWDFHIGKPLQITQDMLKLGLKDYNEYLEYINRTEKETP